jgi:predicted small metal-binding protein
MSNGFSYFHLERRKEEVRMEVIRCRDVGVNCDFEARGQTEQEVMQQLSDHARSGHGMQEIPAELVTKVKAAIHEEKAA